MRATGLARARDWLVGATAGVALATTVYLSLRVQVYRVAEDVVAAADAAASHTPVATLLPAQRRVLDDDVPLGRCAPPVAEQLQNAREHGFRQPQARAAAQSFAQRWNALIDRVTGPPPRY